MRVETLDVGTSWEDTGMPRNPTVPRERVGGEREVHARRGVPAHASREVAEVEGVVLALSFLGLFGVRLQPTLIDEVEIARAPEVMPEREIVPRPDGS